MKIIEQLKKLFNRKKPETGNPKAVVEIWERQGHAEKMRAKYSRTIIANAIAAESQIRALVGEGVHKAQLRVRMGTSHQILDRYLDILQITVPDTKVRKMHPIIDEIRKAREAGLTYAEIGRMHNLSRERVRQIICKDAPDLAEKEMLVKKTEARMPEDQKPVKKKRKRRPRIVIRRKLAVQIMAHRKQGKTWDQVAEAIVPGSTGPLLRSRIQPHLDVIFTPEERKEFFPKKGTWLYRP